MKLFIRVSTLQSIGQHVFRSLCTKRDIRFASSKVGRGSKIPQLGNSGIKIRRNNPYDCYLCPGVDGGGPTHKCEVLWDLRKYGHQLPSNNVCTPFPPLCTMPSGIFRCTDNEALGPCASKNGCYKNPEYYSFHDRSFFDLHLTLRPCRLPQIQTGRKPISF